MVKTRMLAGFHFIEMLTAGAKTQERLPLVVALHPQRGDAADANSFRIRAGTRSGESSLAWSMTNLRLQHAAGVCQARTMKIRAC
jgi:hypothetical protein